MRLAPGFLLLALIVGCDSSDDEPLLGANPTGEQLAIDTVAREWRMKVKVDSVEHRGDTTTFWIIPEEWKATDMPTSGVHVVPGKGIVGITRILGG